MWRRIKWLWARFADIWLAKDVAVAIGVSTALGSIMTPIVAWLFDYELNIFGLLVLAVAGGVIAFFLAIWLAPRIRNIYHKEILVKTSSQVSVSPVVNHADQGHHKDDNAT
jgi:ABC-type transport system involved in cytochrome c biogenesis permease component